MADTLNVFQHGLWMAVLLSAPPLVIATMFGVVISLIQAVTQIQDQTLPYVCKVVSVSLTLTAMGRWIGVELLGLMDLIFAMIPGVGH